MTMITNLQNLINWKKIKQTITKKCSTSLKDFSYAKQFEQHCSVVNNIDFCFVLEYFVCIKKLNVQMKNK